MNDNPTTDASECCTQFEDRVRDNPIPSIVMALGAGLVIGLVIRALQPPPTTTRAARLLEDLQDRLHDLTDRASSLAGDGVERVRDMGLDRSVRSLSQRVRNLFH